MTNPIRVMVQDGKFEKAMRLFKKKVDDCGLLKELKDREQYTKPTVERKLKKNAAKKRWQKKVEATKLPERLY